MLTNCVIAGSRGGGVQGGTLYDCVVSGKADVGVDWATLHRCALTGNRLGGASHSTLYNCTLTGNRSSGAFGSTLYNCILTGNSGPGADSSTLDNCTLVGNSASQSGGGTYACQLRNCIVYFNTPDNIRGGACEYSCTTPLPPGPGNIDADPRFVNAAAGDFRLLPDSPCIDAGTNLVDLITTDIEGSPRPLEGNGDGIARFDMGAYESDPGVLLKLSVALTPNGLRLDWPATALGAKLQRTATLTNPLWQDVPGSETATTLTLPLANADEFFRLVKP